MGVFKKSVECLPEPPAEVVLFVEVFQATLQEENNEDYESYHVWESRELYSSLAKAEAACAAWVAGPCSKDSFSREAFVSIVAVR